MSRLRKRASESWERKYKGDWVYKFKWEEKNRYEYRIEYYECGIFEFYKELGCEEFVRYLCKLDFLACYKIGVKLERLKTIAEGDSICDFRYYR